MALGATSALGQMCKKPHFQDGFFWIALNRHVRWLFGHGDSIFHLESRSCFAENAVKLPSNQDETKRQAQTRLFA